MNKTVFLALIFFYASFPVRSRAQDAGSMQHQQGQAPAQKKDQSKPGQQDQTSQMPGMPGMQSSEPATLIDEIFQHKTSGTAAEPNSIQAPMITREKGKWMLMFHGEAFLNTTQQRGARGYDKVFSTNWFMPMAQRPLGQGLLTLRTMLSLEPATVTHRFYPELFQQGETAFGKPINDGQHPHDFFIELAALYDWKLGRNALLSFYVAPLGDPAMGPVAYAHRASASENPAATLGHH